MSDIPVDITTTAARTNTGPVTLRKGAQGQEVQIGDSLSVAAAAQEKSQMEAAFVLAQMQPPRDLDGIRARALAAVSNPTLAQMWLYRRPVGRKQNDKGEWEDAFAEGTSIRGAEVLGQIYGKLYISSRILHESNEQSLIHVSAMDLQNIIIYGSDAAVPKTVERRRLKPGQASLGVRETSTGNTVYVVAATVEEVASKVAAARSKLIRDNMLRLIPRDLLDEVVTRVKEVCADTNAKDPAAAKKKICDKFMALGVTPEMLAAYMGVSLDALTLQHLGELQFIHNGLKEGSFTWAQLMATKDEEAEGEGQPEAAAPPSKLKQQVQAARQSRQPKQEQPPQETEQPK